MIIDNVLFVVVFMGMYEMLMDFKFWYFIVYFVGIGGSMLIIGLVVGVVVMGMECIDFIWYFRKIVWLVLVGFLVGVVVFFVIIVVFYL